MNTMLYNKEYPWGVFMNASHSARSAPWFLIRQVYVASAGVGGLYCALSEIASFVGAISRSRPAFSCPVGATLDRDMRSP